MRTPTTRRRFLAATVAGASLGIAGCSAPSVEGVEATEPSTTEPLTTEPPTTEPATTESPQTEPRTTTGLPDAVGLETLTDGLAWPVGVAFAPAADRRYVVERDGRVLVHGPDGLAGEPFLDLRDSVVTEGEQGLLGIALHPAFARNRRVFLRYSAPRRPEMRTDYTHRFLLSEFEATRDGRRGRPGSERVVLEIPQISTQHNAGDVAFGPDGYCYVPVGDSAHRRYAQDVVDRLFGGVLRIDVDVATPERAYGVPDDNPLVGRAGLDEYYAWGFRNPWRVSFDGSDFFVADVGQEAYEEVNLVEKGGNYGWDVKEGTHCFQAEACPDTTPPDVRGDERLRDPVIEYPHGEGPVSGIAVVGGYVYRGSALPDLEGVYLFGDLLARGRLFAATRSEGPGLWPTEAIEMGGAGESLQQILSFGRGPDGEVYVLGTGTDGGGLYRIVPDS